MIPNTKVRVFAFNRITGDAVTGDAANITATWSKDYGTPVSLGVNPTEIGGGFYIFDLTTTQRDVAIEGFLQPVSATANVRVVIARGIENASRSIASDIDTGANNWDSAMNTWQDAQLSVITSSAFFVGVLADTNELQTDWANGGRLDLLLDAVKAKTDLISAGQVYSVAPITRTGSLVDVQQFEHETQLNEVFTTTVDYSSTAIECIWERESDTTEVAKVDDSGFTKTSSTLAINTIPVAVRSTVRTLKYSIRVVATEQVISTGNWIVSRAPRDRS